MIVLVPVAAPTKMNAPPTLLCMFEVPQPKNRNSELLLLPLRLKPYFQGPTHDTSENVYSWALLTVNDSKKVEPAVSVTKVMPSNIRSIQYSFRISAAAAAGANTIVVTPEPCPRILSPTALVVIGIAPSSALAEVTRKVPSGMSSAVCPERSLSEVDCTPAETESLANCWKTPNAAFQVPPEGPPNSGRLQTLFRSDISWATRVARSRTRWLRLIPDRPRTR